MKKLILLVATPLLVIMVLCGVTNLTILVNELRVIIDLNNNTLTHYKDIISNLERIKVNSKFDYVYKKFKVYNENIDSSTVNIFIDVTDKFDCVTK